MKKLVSLFLALMLTVGLLPVVHAEENIELTFCNWGDGTEQKMFEHVFDLFHQEHPNITVKYLYIPYSEYLTKLNTMAASGTMPDMGTDADGERAAVGRERHVCRCERSV